MDFSLNVHSMTITLIEKTLNVNKNTACMVLKSTLSQRVKSQILFSLIHNLEKQIKTGQPNNYLTRCAN